MDVPSLDRKFEQEQEQEKELEDLLSEVASQVTILKSSLSSSSLSDCLAARRAVLVLRELAEKEVIANSIVNRGAVSDLLKLLKAVPEPYEHEVENGLVLVFWLLAVKKTEHQQLIVDAGASIYLMDLLKRHKTFSNSPALTGLIKIAVGAIVYLAKKKSRIETRIRLEGVIPPLVGLLEFDDAMVQILAARALVNLAFQDYDNRKQIVECNALPTLVLMLGSKDAAIHSEAVFLIEDLVLSSPNITREILLAGALQPLIGLLKSSCSKIQIKAAHLIGQLARTRYDWKAHIAQRGAIQPLIDMLKSPDVELWEMSAFAVRNLAQDKHNQAGIAYNGGIEPLLNLLCSRDGSFQLYAAIALYHLASNEDNFADIVKVGGVQKLQDRDFNNQFAKQFAVPIIKRLKEKMHGRVLKQLLYLMRFGEKAVQRHVALALAHLSAPDDWKFIFVDNNGLELLLDVLESANLEQKREASIALHSLAVRTTFVSTFVADPPSPTAQVHLGEQYVNNPKFSDITFLVEGERFYAHRICLLASSDVFRAMLEEKEAKHMLIPNMKWDVFELMMRFIYTGIVDVNSDVAQDLLKAADQYLLDGLKRPCECAIAQDVSVENVSLMYELSESLNAISLRHACILFLLEQFDKLSPEPWYRRLMHRIIPDIRKFFVSLLTKPTQA